MGEDSVILEGAYTNDFSALIEQVMSMYSTVHGAGRVLGRMEAKGKPPKPGRMQKQNNGTEIWIEPNPGRPGKVTKEMMNDWVTSAGVELRGAGVDESPHCYKRLSKVLEHHSKTVKVLHTLTPIGVAMAGPDIRDPYKD